MKEDKERRRHRNRTRPKYLRVVHQTFYPVRKRIVEGSSSGPSSSTSGRRTRWNFSDDSKYMLKWRRNRGSSNTRNNYFDDFYNDVNEPYE